VTAKLWPPPGFPIVDGKLALTSEWSIYLPENFARRIEDGSLVLWRPGLTFWLIAWGNDHNQSQELRLAAVKKVASPQRYAEHEVSGDGVIRYRYRLRDENVDGPVECLTGLVFSDNGHIQISAYFDDLSDEATAEQVIDSVERRCDS
jgi:hypothetical protein